LTPSPVSDSLVAPESPPVVAASTACNWTVSEGKVARAPWYLWTGTVAVSLIEFGAIWDLSWHRSIGRDGFWTPAHMMVQAGGLTCAVVCGYLILMTTFGSSAAARAAAVSVFGLRAPIGAFIAAWGGITMVISAPFDNWWHATYGLDATIVSPPHAVLLGGVLCVELGVLILTVSAMNRAEQAKSPAFKSMERMFFYVGGLILISQMYYAFFYLNNIYLHGARPYKATGAVAVVVLLMISQAHRHRWSATIICCSYMVTMILSILILPLFPAQPKLGPVFYPVTHLVPTNFPILLIFPAMVLDLLWERTREWKPWLLAPLSGIVFTAVLVAFEWPFADFLMTKWAANRFFGTIYYGFNARGTEVLHAFQRPAPGELFSHGIVEAMIFSSAGAWIGIAFGRWMRSVRR
jgi:hypothetical protein